VHAPELDHDEFDGAHHPAPFVPPAAQPESAGKSVGVEVHLASTGRVEKAVISRSSGSALLDKAARCWAQYEWIYSPSPKPRTERHALTFSHKSVDEREDVRIARSVIPDTRRSPYPYLARRLHKEGAVDLLLRLRRDGTIDEAVVTKSASFVLLDLIVREWARRYWKLKGLSKKEVRCRIVFTLTPHRV
jgi:TonB family protein